MMNEASAKHSVLLVDDDKFLIDLYSTKFTRAGYDVHACLSCKDALAALRNGFLPDAILFDIQMPEHDGFWLLQTLLNEHLAPNAPLIALTNQSTAADEEKARQLGASQFIVKATMTPAEVVATVGKLLKQQAQ